MKTFVSIAAALLLAAACAAPPPPREALRPTGAGQRELGLTMGFMPGTYESINQDKGPGAGVRMRIAEFWKPLQKTGEFWMYMEQAKIGAEDKPFTQRIYRIVESDGKFWAEIYALPADAKNFVGEWRKPQPFAAYNPAQLREYAGCRMSMGHMTIMFWMRTESKGCRAENRDVAYETTEILGNSAGMKQGTVGFDPAGRQIAGEAGAWDFRRIAATPR